MFSFEKKNMSPDRPSTFRELSNDSNVSKSKNTSFTIPIENVPSYEEHWLRNTITLYLPRLRLLYRQYSTVACLKNVPFTPVMIRLFLWQLYRDCKIVEKGLSLVETDIILANLKDGGIETFHNPFEKIYFWQFLHSLISVAWHLYGSTIMCDGNDSILKNVFTKFLEEDIFPNARHYRGSVLFEYKDLLPLYSVYGWYLSIGEPHTVRNFLQKSCVIRKHEPPAYKQAPPSAETPYILSGSNVVTIDQHVSYFTKEKDNIQDRPVTPFTYANNEDPYRLNLYLFRNLGAKKILNCIKTICPCIHEEDVIVDIDYPLSFLEFYEIVLLCAKKLIKYEEKMRQRDRDLMTKMILNEVMDRTECMVLNSSSSRRLKKHGAHLKKK